MDARDTSAALPGALRKRNTWKCRLQWKADIIINLLAVEQEKITDRIGIWLEKQH
jgi:hypothetical protein